MKTIFVYYPKCDTCRKAAKWLKENDIEVESRDIVSDNPTEQELTDWVSRSEMPVAKFFNTSGLKYKAMGLKGVVKSASDVDLIKLLASDGMLVKRPVLICEGGVTVGFKEDAWSSLLKTK